MALTCRGWMSSALLLCACLLSGAVSAQGVTTDTGGGAVTGLTVSLDGPGWVIAPDVQNVGRDQKWWNGPTPEAIEARVPGIIQESLPRHHGVAWYWREFEAPKHPSDGGRYLLKFWAVDYMAEVWVNGTPVGGHEGSETPFVLDATAAVKPGAVNQLAVRVLNPIAEPIDGIVFAEIPRRNKGLTLPVGGGMNYGGIIEPVELMLVPAVYVDDVFVRADWKTGAVRVQATVRNAGVASMKGNVCFLATTNDTGRTAAAAQTSRELPTGNTVIEMDLQVTNHQLWDLDRPYLYRMSVSVAPDGGKPQPGNGYSVRFGFRDFRVEKGYFRLNGRRIFLKSSHTGNHCPIGQILAPAQARDLLRRDLVYAKACGFNTIRYIAGVGHPYQHDLCDEMGLMVYEECLAGWCMNDSPKMVERFDRSVREMILRDRNHPSVTIWGLLNETGDGPVFRRAVDSLSMVRTLDDSRLVLLGSGRWDKQFNIGSLSNPGSSQWECQWGIETPGDTPPAVPAGPQFGGFMPGAGDAHVYPGTPHTPEIEDGIRTLGADTKPVFLSEYGIGSQNNSIRESRYYEQAGANPDYEDTAYYRATAEKFTADWLRLGMDGVYAFPEDMLLATQAMHCRQRLLGFNLIRSNPKICGYNLTGLLDHGFSGEGLWTFWREWKPGIADALSDGWAPLRWCTFVRPMHGYVNKPMTVEVVLANEDVLRPGDYPVCVRVAGAKGIAWEKKTTVTIAQPPAGEDGPLAVPVFKGDVTLAEPGEYQLAVTMEKGGAPAGGRLKFYVSDVPAASKERTVVALGIDDSVQRWLKEHGVTCIPFDGASADARQLILVGDLSKMDVPGEKRVELMRRVAQGGVCVFFSPGAFRQGDDAVKWLPLEKKGRGYDFSDWLYHKVCVAKGHALFDGLQGKGVMDWDFYGPVIPHFIFEGQDTPDDVAAAAFALCHSAAPAGYACGLLTAGYNFGAGRFCVNSLNILGNIDQHPAADRLLLNFVENEAERAQGKPAPVPADFEDKMKAIGYKS